MPSSHKCLGLNYMKIDLLRSPWNTGLLNISYTLLFPLKEKSPHCKSFCLLYRIFYGTVSCWTTLFVVVALSVLHASKECQVMSVLCRRLNRRQYLVQPPHKLRTLDACSNLPLFFPRKKPGPEFLWIVHLFFPTKVTLAKGCHKFFFCFDTAS